MEQLNRLTRSLRRARTVELPDGELGRAAGAGAAGAGAGGGARAPGRAGGGKRPESRPPARVCFPELGEAGPGLPGPRRAAPPRAGGTCGQGWAVRVLRGRGKKQQQQESPPGRMAGTQVPGR